MSTDDQRFPLLRVDLATADHFLWTSYACVIRNAVTAANLSRVGVAECEEPVQRLEIQVGQEPRQLLALGIGQQPGAASPGRYDHGPEPASELIALVSVPLIPLPDVGR